MSYVCLKKADKLKVTIAGVVIAAGLGASAVSTASEFEKSVNSSGVKSAGKQENVKKQDQKHIAGKASLTHAPWSSIKAPAVSFDLDVRDLRKAPDWKVGDAIKDMPRRRLDPNYVQPGKPKNRVPTSVDPLVKSQAEVEKFSQLMKHAPDVKAVVQNFDGPGFTGVNPPDPTGDVGKTYYIQMINSAGGAVLSIYNKFNGELVAGPTELDALGSGNCATGKGDPIVLYDELAERWFLSEFSNSGNRLCIYVSKTDNPITGGWHTYDFQAPSFPDYPKYGIWNNAYYIGTNESGSNSPVYALDRAAMLEGNPANFVRLATAPKLSGFGFQMITPVDHEGDLAPPAGTPGYFLRHRDDEVHNASSNDNTRDFVELWEFNVDFSNPAQSTFTKKSDIPVAEFSSDLCGLTSFSCFPQPGTSTQLDPLREPIMNRPQYRNFGSYETIVANFVVDVDGSDHGGIRWFELRREGAGEWQLYQEGTYAPDSENRWMGSAAMDKNGNIAIAYSYGSSSVNPGIRQTGRKATDPLGTMTQAEEILVEGTSNNASNRWGDYSHLAVDPSDDCTFWFTNQYGKESGRWGTQVSSFRFADCATAGGNFPPSASFTFDCTGLTCSFDGSASSDSDGEIVSYAWDFSDGGTATGVTASHTFREGGDFNVILTVTDNEGASISSVKKVSIVGPSQVLFNGFPKTIPAGAAGSEKFFVLNVPEDAQTLSINMFGGTGDADMYVRYGDRPTTTQYDCRPFRSGNNESCDIFDVKAGTYHIMVRAYSAYSVVSLIGKYQTEISGEVFSNDEDINIPDNDPNGIASAINVTRTGESGEIAVRVNIQHTYIGDLKVDLIHPDGTAYNLHNRTGGSTDNINQIYTVNVGDKPANGEWRLQVSDSAFLDSGLIDFWSITFSDD